MKPDFTALDQHLSKRSVLGTILAGTMYFLLGALTAISFIAALVFLLTHGP